MRMTYKPDEIDLPDEYKENQLTPRLRKVFDTDEPFQRTLDKLYFDISGFGGWMPITKMAVSIIRSDRLCFGTDYGYEINEAIDIRQFITDIKSMDISETAKRAILGENMRRLFKID